MHNDALGAQGTGGAHVGDYTTDEDKQAGYGPYKTRQLLVNNPSQCITNADNFAYLAYEILWTKNCLSDDSRFKDPVADNSVATDIPTVDALATITGVSFVSVYTATATAVPFTTAVGSSPPSCEHAADPSGGMGLCPDLSNGGWCDCGVDGDFQMLPDGLCAYSAIPTTGTLALTTTDCVVQSTETAVPTVALPTTVVPTTVVSTPVPTCPVSNDDHWPTCDECPGGYNQDSCIASEASAACDCNDPCGDAHCVF